MQPRRDLKDQTAVFDSISHLEEIAIRGLASNIVDTPKGPLLLAGPNQFATLWTRDFCFSASALFHLGLVEVVRSSFDLLYENRRIDGLVPRGMDVINPKLRVVINCLFPGLRWILPDWRSMKSQIRPEFRGEHGTIAFDSNLLLARVALNLNEEAKAIELLKFYLPQYLKDGLLLQPAFSDWQDSVQRAGAGLYSQLLLLDVISESPRIGAALGIEVSDFRRRVLEQFSHPNSTLLSQSIRGQSNPLEANLWIAQGLLGEPTATLAWQALRMHPMAMSGIPMAEHYPVEEIAWTTKLVGLRHYHDGLRWSWLAGEYLKTASKRNDQVAAVHMLRNLAEGHLNLNAIHEVYEPDAWIPFSSRLYNSEQPFSWGSAKIIEGLSMVKNWTTTINKHPT
jgi:hypothetical protein